MRALPALLRLATTASCVTWSCAWPTQEFPPDVDGARPSPGFVLLPANPPPSATQSDLAPPASLSLATLQLPGFVLLDMHGREAARAETDLPVVDAVFDRSTRHVVAFEYEDASASQLSAWHVSRSAQELQLTRIAVRPAEGYARLFSTPAGILLVEHDGLQGHWSLLDAALSSPAWRVRAPVPSTMFASERSSTRQSGIVQADTVDGPVVTLHEWDITDLQPNPVRSDGLPASWSSLSPIRACVIGTDRLVITRIDHAQTFVDVLSPTSLSVLSSSSAFAGTSGSVADILCDPSEETAYVLLTDPVHAALARVWSGQIVRIGFPLAPVRDGGPWPSRRLAYHAGTKQLVIAADTEVVAIDARNTDADATWRRGDLRDPVLALTLEDAP